MDDAKALIASSGLKILACDNLDEAASMVCSPVFIVRFDTWENYHFSLDLGVVESYYS